MPAVTYRAYHRTAWALGPVLIVHGRYDGLATAPVTHPHAQLFVPLAGRAHVAPVGGPGLVIGPEEGIWIPAGVAHAASSLGAEVEFLAVNAPPAWAPELAAAHGLPAPRPGLRTARDAGLWLAGRLLAHALPAPPGGDGYVEAGLRQLGLLWLAADARGAGTRALDAGVLRAVDHVFAHHAEDLTVAGLAALAGLGVRQFERRFQVGTGLAPRRFLIAVRLAAARELLLGTDLAIETIAERTGFADATHLARAFRAASGMTPAAWRRSRRAGGNFNPSLDGP